MFAHEFFERSGKLFLEAKSRGWTDPEGKLVNRLNSAVQFMDAESGVSQELREFCNDVRADAAQRAD